MFTDTLDLPHSLSSSIEREAQTEFGFRSSPPRPVSVAPPRSYVPVVEAVAAISQCLGELDWRIVVTEHRCHWLMSVTEYPDLTKDAVMVAVLHYDDAGVRAYVPRFATKIGERHVHELLGVMVRLTRSGVEHIYPPPSDPIDEAVSG